MAKIEEYTKDTAQDSQDPTSLVEKFKRQRPPTGQVERPCATKSLTN